MFFKITSKPHHESLYTGLYRVYIVGGWTAQTGLNFALEIVNTDSGKIMPLEKKFLGGRDYKHGRRAVHYYDLLVDISGEYKISVRHPEDIQVRRSMLFIMHLFEGPVPTNQIEIWIERVTL